MKKNSSTEESGGSIGRIVEIAMALFAEHGYHGVSTREIAAATGLSVATVHHHVGSKHELYVKVFRSLLEEAEVFFTEVAMEVGGADVSDPAVLLELPGRMVERFVDLVDRNPVQARLFLRHWLDDAEEFNAVEAELSLPLFRKIDESLIAAKEAGLIQLSVEPRLFIRSFEWLVYGYFVCGAFDWEHWHRNPHDPAQLLEFKQLIREYIGRMLGLPVSRS